ncbi:MAG TPA: glycosyltransferase [Flavobacterium sp.]|nr:glycosyltransferase [Flavobacterium sp.]
MGQKDTKIKILHITQVQGGIQTYIEQIYHNIDNTKFEIEIACPEEQKSLVEFAKANNIKWYPLKLKWQISPISDLLSTLRIAHLVRKSNPDLVHAHSSKAGFVTRIASIFFKPTVLYTPNAYAFLGHKGIKRSIFLTIEKISRLFTDILLASSKSEEIRSIKEVKIPKHKVRLFPNSIDIPEFTRVDKSRSANQTITTVGRLVYQKNPMMFLRVCKILKDRGVNAHFQIIGAGFEDRLKEEIDSLMKEYDLFNNLTIFDWMNREELIRKLQETDVFVMTSNFESFGYVAAEAQSLKIPVVTTDVDGLNEIVADNETGFLIQVDDDNRMADKIIWLLEHKEKAKEMGQKGRERVTEQFNIRTNIAILENIYKEYSS